MRVRTYLKLLKDGWWHLLHQLNVGSVLNNRVLRNMQFTTYVQIFIGKHSLFENESIYVGWTEEY